jgi:hypothetical protein
MSKRILAVMFQNGPRDLITLWRMTRGSRSKAFQLVVEYCQHWGFTPDEFSIDEALAELNGGLEVEWESE